MDKCLLPVSHKHTHCRSHSRAHQRLMAHGPWFKSIMKWKKLNPFPFFFAVYQNICQILIFGKCCRQIFFLQRVWKFRVRHHRFYRYLVKTQLRHMNRIFCKVQIMLGKRTSYIIILVPSGLQSAFCILVQSHHSNRFRLHVHAAYH